MPRRDRSALLLASLLAAAACVPGPGPCDLPAVQGCVLDRDTGDPIAGAIVIEWWLGQGRMGEPPPVYETRFAITDASGRFSLPTARTTSGRLVALHNEPPRYGFAQPDYGLVRGGEAPEPGVPVTLRGGRDDVAAHQALAAICESPPTEDWERALRTRLCPTPVPRPRDAR